MISLMDNLLKRENLDLRLTPYTVLPTGNSPAGPSSLLLLKQLVKCTAGDHAEAHTGAMLLVCRALVATSLHWQGLVADTHAGYTHAAAPFTYCRHH
jgi:hypothetical protein